MADSPRRNARSGHSQGNQNDGRVADHIGGSRSRQSSRLVVTSAVSDDGTEFWGGQ
jgi:hypothetical protein